jgi:hypothetical protein
MNWAVTVESIEIGGRNGITTSMPDPPLACDVS